MEFLGYEFDLSLILFNLLRLGLAFFIALPIGWEREKSTRLLGLRTFPLVAIGTCAFVLIGQDIAEGDPNARTRIVEGLMAGLGFIGGGAILKKSDHVKGTATAASVWSTGAVGAAVGFGRVEIAVVVAVINFAILRWLHPLQERISSGDD